MASKAAVEAADRFMGGLLQKGVTRDEVAAWLEEYARAAEQMAYEEGKAFEEWRATGAVSGRPE